VHLALCPGAADNRKRESMHVELASCAEYLAVSVRTAISRVRASANDQRHAVEVEDSRSIEFVSIAAVSSDAL